MVTMRRIRTFIEMLYRQFINDLKINIVILCTLILTFSFVFLISKEVISKFSEYGDLSEAVRTYEVRFSGANSVEAFNSILKEFKKKKIDQITYINLTVKNNDLRHINFCFDTQNAYLNPNNMVKKIISGRDFSKSELENGLNAIILSQKDYSKYYRDYNVGDIITFAGHDFELIGISKDDSKKIGSVLPFSTILKYKELFRINEAFLTLTERLSKKEIRELINSAKNGLNDDVEYRITTSSSWVIESLVKNISGSIIAALIVILLSTFNIINLIAIIRLRNKRVMKIYKNLGYEDKYIIFNFVTILFILTAISIFAGIYLSRLFGPVIKAIIPIY